MTTIIDPAGSPSPVYNKSGTTIVSLTAGLSSVGSTSQVVGDDGVAIPAYSQTTVAVVATSGSSGAYHIASTLSADADVGDVVEVYSTGSRDGQVFPPVGANIGSHPVSTGTNNDAGVPVPLLSGIRLRKVSATQWMPIGAV